MIFNINSTRGHTGSLLVLNYLRQFRDAWLLLTDFIFVFAPGTVTLRGEHRRSDVHERETWDTQPRRKGPCLKCVGTLPSESE